LAGLDGILSPGGHDIHPSYFTRRASAADRLRMEQLHAQYGNDGNTQPRHLARDRHENAVMRAYFSDPRFERMPLLGVCYGMQMMAAVHDVPLYVDLEAELRIPAQRGVHNEIRFTSSDRGLLGALPATFSAYKNHHQGVSLEALRRNPELGRNLRVRATSHNGRVAEVLEAVNRPAVGVQFHSEARGQNDARVAPAIFGWLLKQACRNQNLRTAPARRAPPPAAGPAGSSILVIE